MMMVMMMVMDIQMAAALQGVYLHDWMIAGNTAHLSRGCGTLLGLGLEVEVGLRAGRRRQGTGGALEGLGGGLPACRCSAGRNFLLK